MTEQNTQQPKQYNILLIGDNGLDVYQFGSVDRISPEAPVPVFVPSHTIEKPGMAGNVYNNLVALGCNVTLKAGEISKKTRYVDKRSKQHIMRMDEDIFSVPMLVNNDLFLGYDAVVIADYGKGTVTYDLIKQAIDTKIPVFVDTKKTELDAFQGAWVKINEEEYGKIRSECSGLIVTRGARGAEVIHHEIKEDAPTVEVVDVTGAGDTFLAALTYQYLKTKNIQLAVAFANRAASITVQHLGCYAPKLEEIR